MEALRIRSQRISTEHVSDLTSSFHADYCTTQADLTQIAKTHQRLRGCNENEYSMENFKIVLMKLSEEASQCASLATEIRGAFVKWGKMAGELLTLVEPSSSLVDIEKKFAGQNADVAKQVGRATNKRVQGSMTRLGGIISE